MIVLGMACICLAAWFAVQPASERRLPLLRGSDASAPRPDVRDQLRRASRLLLVGPRARRERAAARMRVIHALGALSSELEAGQPPDVAILECGGDPSVWPMAEAAARSGGDVAEALVADARRHPVLGQIAACWRVSASSGSGLATAVAQTVAAARSAEDVFVDLETQLAGPRATARMLSGLPLLGIAFGMMLGSDPLTWLVATMPGRVCLLGGIGLTALGMWWTGRIGASVERLL